MDRRGGGGDGSLCGHWSTRRFSRCPTLNPRLRCSAPARPPPPSPLAMDDCPSSSSSSGGRAQMPPPREAIPPLLGHRQRPSIRPYCSRSCWPGTRGAAGWNPAAPGELRDEISAQPGTATTVVTTAQHRIPSSTDKEKRKRGKEDATSGHCISLLGPPTASRRHWLPTAWTLDRPSHRRPVVGLVALSAGKDALIVKTHHHAAHPPPGRPPESWRSCPTAPWKCGQCLVSSPGVCAAFPYHPPRWLLPHPECLHGLFPAVSRDRSSFVSCHLVREVPGQTDRPEEVQIHPPSTQTGR